jgi:hypothetical protein
MQLGVLVLGLGQPHFSRRGEAEELHLNGVKWLSVSWAGFMIGLLLCVQSGPSLGWGS